MSVGAEVTSESGPARASMNGAPDARRKFAALNPNYPKGWWMIAFSGDVGRSRVRALRVLESDVVLWRDTDGDLSCQSAHCPHLGAHLGYGGEVQGKSIRCPFHGWRFGSDGQVVDQPGPLARHQRNGCLDNFRVVERYGAIFLWNGADEPDHDMPDVLEKLEVSEDDVVFAQHRWFLPFPAKWFVENVCDGMHFAIAHDAAEWGETVVTEETPTSMVMRDVLHGPRRWYSIENVKRRFYRRELMNLLTPVTNDLIMESYCGTLHLIRLLGAGKLGSNFASWTPVDDTSHYLMSVVIMPKIRIPIVGPQLQRLLNFGMAIAEWSTVVQDAPIMLHRKERVNPAYTPYDKGLIKFRRLWDSRIETNQDGALLGDGIHNNGLAAGIRLQKRTLPGEGRSHS